MINRCKQNPCCGDQVYCTQLGNTNMAEPELTTLDLSSMVTPNVSFTYTNYRGDTELRTVQPAYLWFGKTVYHPQRQMLLKAYDQSRNDMRDFAVKDIIDWPEDIVLTVRPAPADEMPNLGGVDAPR